MADWQFTEAAEKLDELLDRAEHEGPQVVWRNGQEFLVITDEQLKAAQILSPAPHPEG